MKNIPIVILNRDRLYPLMDQVTSLRNKGYNNITVIDNQSTYQPLLDWYKQSGLDVFYNDVTENSCHAFRDLVLMQHPKFIEITSNWYVFNDSDIIPLDSVPDNAGYPAAGWIAVTIGPKIYYIPAWEIPEG